MYLRKLEYCVTLTDKCKPQTHTEKVGFAPGAQRGNKISCAAGIRAAKAVKEKEEYYEKEKTYGTGNRSSHDNGTGRMRRPKLGNGNNRI